MGELSSIILILVFIFLALDVVAPPLIAIEGVHWARDGPKFACRVDGCDASSTTKYNLVQHLRACHNVVMEPSKPKHGYLEGRLEGSRSHNHEYPGLKQPFDTSSSQ